MKRYEAYKSCNIPWIKQIPEHWGAQRGKNLYRKEQRAVRDTDEVVTCFRDGRVTLRKNRRTTGFTEALNEIGYQGIRKGDLVIHVMDAFAGAIGVSDSDGKGTPVYNVCTPKGDSNNYYYAYALREMARAGFIQSLYRGIRERSSDFRFDVFARQYLPVPPRDEQDQIVRYLDWQVSKINRLIAAKRKELKLLEQTTALNLERIICEGTRGEELIETGNPWISTAPKSWKKLRHKNVLTEKKVIVVDTYSQYTLLSLTTKGIIVRDISSGKGKFPSDFSTYQVVKPSDMVFCLFDVDETPRTVGLSTHTGMITGAYSVYETHNVLPEFLLHYFTAIDNKKGFKPLYSGLRKVIGKDVFSRQSIYLPSVKEQKEIVAAIDASQKKCKKAMDLFEQEIIALTDLRTRLISDVVTGKIDVRSIKVPDYELVDDVVQDSEDGEPEVE